MSLAALQNLAGKVALVTGGSRGLGLQMAEVLGELGATVAITARKAHELEAAREHLSAQGIKCVPIVCDMGKLDSIGPMIDEVIRTVGPIDILINNAGTSWGAPTTEHTLEAWNKVIALNLSALFVASQEVGKRCMLDRGWGRIVNIASVQGLTGGYPEGIPTIAYNASKGGVVNFTRTLANEWATTGITVNAIAPGFFLSKMTQHLFDTMGDKTSNLAPMKRGGGPEDLKGVTALLATDAGAYITGQIIAVDGGLTMAF